MPLIKKNFLLPNPTAEKLYYEYAEAMPIIDYHSHLSAQDIASDRKFNSITDIWLAGDHYKWRAMRANGISEDLITGKASNLDKFKAWAHTLPAAARNPLYHWAYLDLSRYFGINDQLLNGDSAEKIYHYCNELLATEAFSARNLILRMNVKALCTTDDPLDSLEHHRKIAADRYPVEVLPTFRPDKAMNLENLELFNSWTNQLEKTSGKNINHFSDFLSAIWQRHDHFHSAGCRISDHGLEKMDFTDYSEAHVEKIFQQARMGKKATPEEAAQFRSAMIVEFAGMDFKKGWAQQLHIGALRNNNSRIYKNIGPDAGCDSIGDAPCAANLSRFLDRLDSSHSLPKTVLYNLNPKDNDLFATMAANFQEESTPGKIQYGPAWWFLDQKDGITNQLNSLSNQGLLSRFIGMLTDSRSLLSFPRHEYFRRVLCGLLGNDLEKGEIFEDEKAVGRMVQDICCHNAAGYFGIGL